MRILLIVLTFAASGCVGVTDYERVRAELSVARDENARLRDENLALQHDLHRANSKIELIDSIIHQELPNYNESSTTQAH